MIVLDFISFYFNKTNIWLQINMHYIQYSNTTYEKKYIVPTGDDSCTSNGTGKKFILHCW